MLSLSQSPRIRLSRSLEEATFLSDEREAEVEFLHSCALLLNKFLGESSF